MVLFVLFYKYVFLEPNTLNGLQYKLTFYNAKRVDSRITLVSPRVLKDLEERFVDGKS